MRSARAKWSIALLAALLNLVGSPMAWANLLGGSATTEAGAAQAMGHELAQQMGEENCHGQSQAPDQPAAPDSMPCCEGGGCHCAAAALSMPMVAETVRLPHLGVSATFDTSTLPANPLDDSLRPPIR